MTQTPRPGRLAILRQNAILFFSRPTHVQSLGIWCSAILTAAVSVTYSQLFSLAETGFEALKREAGVYFLVSAPMLYVIAWYVVHRYAPNAAGSGIPQIIAANELAQKGAGQRALGQLLSVRNTIIKIISSLLCVLGGGAIGREGPTLQISATLFYLVGHRIERWAPKAAASPHTWIVAGAASGLASAFNTPLGGIVYAIEELGTVHFAKVRTSILSGVIVSGLGAQWLQGSYLYLGYPKLVPAGFSILPFAILVGLLAGTLGAMFGKSLLFISSWRRGQLGTFKLAILALACGAAVVGLGQYDHRANGPGLNLINGILFSSEAADPLLVIARMAATQLSYLSGVAGGIFSPSLAIGAAVGKSLSQFYGTEYTNLITLLGMIGFLTGVTRAPFTAFILVLEMTDRHSAIFPMMLAALSANWMAQFVQRESFYEVASKNFLKPAA